MKKDYNALFEEKAEAFYWDTGMMTPGKDDISGSHSREERVKKWDEWLRGKD